MKINMNKVIFAATTAVALCCISSLASAKTPDGLTPAVETFCDDNFIGNARGLCIAYCEAADCDLLFDNNPTTVPKASLKACDTLLNQFKQAGNKAGATGINFETCKKVVCPCGTLQAEPSFAFPGNFAFRKNCATRTDDEAPFYGVDFTNNTFLTCRSTNNSQPWNFPTTPSTLDEANACVAQLRNLSTQCQQGLSNF